MLLAYEWTKKRGAYYNFFLSWLRETFAAEAHANEGRGGNQTDDHRPRKPYFGDGDGVVGGRGDPTSLEPGHRRSKRRQVLRCGFRLGRWGWGWGCGTRHVHGGVMLDLSNACDGTRARLEIDGDLIGLSSVIK